MTDTTCSTEDGDLVSGLCGGGELSSGGSGEHCVDGCLVDRRSKSRSRNVPVEDRVYLKSPLLPRRALLPLYRSGRPFELCAVGGKWEGHSRARWNRRPGPSRTRGRGREEVEKGGKSSWEMGYGQHSSTQLTQHVLISTLDTVLKQNTETETTRTA